MSNDKVVYGILDPMTKEVLSLSRNRGHILRKTKKLNSEGVIRAEYAEFVQREFKGEEA